MSALSERKRKGAVQTNDDKNEEYTKKHKKVKSRKRLSDQVVESESEHDQNSFNEMTDSEISDQCQDQKSRSSEGSDADNFDTQLENNNKVNSNEVNKNFENVENENAICKTEFETQQNELYKDAERNNHVHIDEIEQAHQNSLVKNDVLIGEENLLQAKHCTTERSDKSLSDTTDVQNTSPLRNCDIEKSNNFEERFENELHQQHEASVDAKLINKQSELLSTSPSSAEGCVSNLKISNEPISDCDTSNVAAAIHAETLSHREDAGQQNNSSALWQNVEQYNNANVNANQCYKSAEMNGTHINESRTEEANEFHKELNRLQNEEIMSKIKSEQDQLATADNRQPQHILSQHSFEGNQNGDATYRGIAQTQQDELQASYGNMFNEMSQRPQQQQQPHQYSHEQHFYQMRMQQQQQQQQQQQHASLLNQHHPNMSLQDSLQDEQLLAYLHQQQQQQQHHQQQQQQQPSNHRPQQDAYGDLVMDEFQEEGNANASANLYKLQLSPAAKHENQDDGYETSAGDVLTPNSHSSSTHSGTPNQSMSVSQHVPSTSALALHNVTQSQVQQQNPHHQHHQPQGHMPAPVTASTLMDSFSPGPPRHNEDPYKFHDESTSVPDPKGEHSFCMPADQHLMHNNQTTNNANLHQISEVALGKPPQKRRGRKKKIHIPEGVTAGVDIGSTDPSSENPLAGTGVPKVKERKKHDRFNGMSEEEVAKRTLPDHLCHNLDIVIVGINPGLFAAYKGHHYAGPGNHFWKCLYLSGLTQEQMSADEDFKLMKYGIGFTNMVQRATKGSADLTRKEIKEGSRVLLEKLQTFQPKIAVFNGKLIFEVFSGKKEFHFGRQPDCVDGTNTYVWVMPSSSARCAQLPRAADKVPFYAALKKFRDYLNGLVPQIDEAECVFTEQRIREMCEQEQARNLAVRNLSQSQQQNNGLSAGTQQQHSQSENTNGGPGPPSLTGDGGNYLGSPANFQSQPEKKKRGRPKKLKIQEIIDPNTGERIQIPTNQQQGSMNDYSNILNLSMVAGEVPKKKRGRPKKVKMIGGATGGGVDGVHAASTAPQQQLSLFNNSPQNVNVQHMAGYGSPISPAIHGSATFNSMSMATPPLPLVHHTNERAPSNDMTTSKQQAIEASSAASPQASLPPGSPNACAVDFEPPNAPAVDHNSSEHELATALQQQAQRNSNFHQWMPSSSQQHFDYAQEEHQQHQQQQQQQQQQYQREQVLSLQMHQQQQQSSPHTSWQTRGHQSFEAINESNQRQQQQQHHHYLMNSSQNEQQRQHAMHQHHQNMEQHQQPIQQQQQQSTDVAAKSLSGLESLVDQIPTIAESEAAAAAAVESRLQALQRDTTPVSLADLQAESVYEPRVLNETTGHESRNSSSSNGGSNTPQHYGTGGNVAANSGGGTSACSSPTINQNIFNSTSNMHRHHSQASSAASSPHAHSQQQQQQQQQQYSSVASNFADHNSAAELLAATAQTPPCCTATTSSTTSATTSHLFSNFSVSHLAASSCNSNSNSNNSKSVTDWSTNGAGGAGGASSPYHHSNLMAAAAIQLTTSPHHQMYIDHHTSMHSHHPAAHLSHSSPHQHHMQVNSFYPPTAQAHHHHHPGMSVTAYGPSTPSQHAHHPHVHNASADYGAYGATAAHMIHMPSPNYPPYGYGTPPPPTGAVTAQNNYSSWNHHHHPSTVPGHHSHHLSMFERLKPSDIGSYTGF